MIYSSTLTHSSAESLLALLDNAIEFQETKLIQLQATIDMSNRCSLLSIDRFTKPNSHITINSKQPTNRNLENKVDLMSFYEETYKDWHVSPSFPKKKHIKKKKSSHLDTEAEGLSVNNSEKVCILDERYFQDSESISDYKKVSEKSKTKVNNILENEHVSLKKSRKRKRQEELEITMGDQLIKDTEIALSEKVGTNNTSIFNGCIKVKENILDDDALRHPKKSKKKKKLKGKNRGDNSYLNINDNMQDGLIIDEKSQYFKNKTDKPVTIGDVSHTDIPVKENFHLHKSKKKKNSKELAEGVVDNALTFNDNVFQEKIAKKTKKKKKSKERETNNALPEERVISEVNYFKQNTETDAKLKNISSTELGSTLTDSSLPHKIKKKKRLKEKERTAETDILNEKECLNSENDSSLKKQKKKEKSTDKNIDGINTDVSNDSFQEGYQLDETVRCKKTKKNAIITNTDILSKSIKLEKTSSSEVDNTFTLQEENSLPKKLKKEKRSKENETHAETILLCTKKLKKTLNSEPGSSLTDSANVFQEESLSRKKLKKKSKKKERNGKTEAEMRSKSVKLQESQNNSFTVHQDIVQEESSLTKERKKRDKKKKRSKQKEDVEINLSSPVKFKSTLTLSSDRNNIFQEECPISKQQVENDSFQKENEPKKINLIQISTDTLPNCIKLKPTFKEKSPQLKKKMRSTETERGTFSSADASQEENTFNNGSQCKKLKTERCSTETQSDSAKLMESGETSPSNTAKDFEDQVVTKASLSRHSKLSNVHKHKTKKKSSEYLSCESDYASSPIVYKIKLKHQHKTPSQNATPKEDLELIDDINKLISSSIIPPDKDELHVSTSHKTRAYNSSSDLPKRKSSIRTRRYSERNVRTRKEKEEHVLERVGGNKLHSKDDLDIVYEKIYEEDVHKNELKRKTLNDLHIILPWKIPPTHTIETNLTRLTTLQKKKLEDLSIKTGLYSDKEDDLIRDNWDDFCVKYNFDPADAELFFPGGFTHGSQAFLMTNERLNFVRYLGKHLPERTLASIYRRFQQLYSNFTKEKFTSEEDALLLHFKKKNVKDKYKILGRLLNRSRFIIKYRYQSLLNKYEISDWGNKYLIES